MSAPEQYIDRAGTVTRVERMDPLRIGDGYRYAVQVDCCDHTNPVKVELITDKRPDVDQRVFVTVTFYGETL